MARWLPGDAPISDGKHFSENVACSLQRREGSLGVNYRGTVLTVPLLQYNGQCPLIITTWRLLADFVVDSFGSCYIDCGDKMEIRPCRSVLKMTLAPLNLLVGCSLSM